MSDQTRAPEPASPVSWALMAMEGSLLYPIVSWLTIQDGRTPLGPVAALGMLVLGYLAARHPRLLRLPIPPIGHGLALAALARLLVSPLPAWPLALGGVLIWLAGAFIPVVVGLVLWWRGTSLADAEFTAEGVRGEFAIAGGVLLLLLAMYGDSVLASPLARTAAVVCYLATGLAAVGLARREAAGSPSTPGSNALVAATTLVMVAVGLGAAALLRPEVASAVLAAAGRALAFVVNILFIPLAWLLSFIQPRGDAQMPQRPAIPRPPLEQLQGDAMPEWLQHLFATLTTLLTILIAAVAVVFLLWALSSILNRVVFRGSVRSPTAIDFEGDPGLEARSLLGSFQRWLAGLAGRAAHSIPFPGGLGGIRDARAAYRALLRWAKHHGIERRPPETPLEFQRRLAAELPEGMEHYPPLTEGYEAARYGGIPAPTAVLERLRERLHALARISERRNR
ncbi:MAG: DUF4129 domain-containing protein [Chloroflexi bacterium]|nr:DUF4129 domain-containing protein [Chloroflexota bacterium]